MCDILQPFVEEARTLYIGNAERLARALACERRRREIEPFAVFEWARHTRHVWNPRSARFHAKANGREQTVYYNEPFVRQQLARGAEADIRDLVWHELGHLFTWHFLGTCRHDWAWQTVGLTVGYVPVGCMDQAKRERMSERMILHQMAAAVAAHREG